MNLGNVNLGSYVRYDGQYGLTTSNILKDVITSEIILYVKNKHIR